MERNPDNKIINIDQLRQLRLQREKDNNFIQAIFDKYNDFYDRPKIEILSLDAMSDEDFDRFCKLADQSIGYEPLYDKQG